MDQHIRVNLLDTQTHTRTPRERYKPIIQLTRFEPALWDELVRLGKDICVVVHKSAAAGYDSLLKLKI
jgi:hypothetical protein